MLRYYRFILLRSRSFIPVENNINVLQHNETQLNIQSFRLLSLKAPVPWQKLRREEREPQALENIKRFTQSADIPIEEDDIEKFINSLTNRGDFYGVRSVMPAFFSRTLLFDFIKTSSLFGSKKALQVINEIQKLFPPGTRHFKPAQLLPLFENLFEKDNCDFPSASKVCNALISADLINDRRVFLEVAAKHLVSKLPYDEAFRIWSSSCSIDNIVSGGNVFFEHVLSDKKISIKLQERRINQLVKFYQRVVTPSDLVAQLIVSLVSTGRMVDAKILWYKLDVACKHFLPPVYKLRNPDDVDVNLVHIREYAQLLEDCVLAELKPKKRKLSRKKNVEIAAEAAPSADEPSPEVPQDETECQLLTIPDGNMAFLLKQWQPFKKRTYKKQRIRKFEVKADQLEALVYAIQEVWVSLIELKNDPKAVGIDEIERFLERNKIPLCEREQKRVDSRAGDLDEIQRFLERNKISLCERLQKRVEKLKEKQKRISVS